MADGLDPARPRRLERRVRRGRPPGRRRARQVQRRAAADVPRADRRRGRGHHDAAPATSRGSRLMVSHSNEYRAPGEGEQRVDDCRRADARRPQGLDERRKPSRSRDRRARAQPSSCSRCSRPAAGAMVGFAAGRAPLGRGLAPGRAASRTRSRPRWSRPTLLMVCALLAHDFSVSYVAQVGSRAVPNWVAVVSLWSSLEGSILFWGLVLGVYIARRDLAPTATRHPEYMPYAIARLARLRDVLQLPARRPGAAVPHACSPVPPDGPGPNPLLQNHVLMIIHPPFLYLGLRRHDDPVRPRLARRCSRAGSATTSSGRCARGCCCRGSS